MNPTLTPTEAPTWFSQAFEDAEKVFSCPAIFSTNAKWKMVAGEYNIFASDEDAHSACGWCGGISHGPLREILRLAPNQRKEILYLLVPITHIVWRDADGIEIKRWSVA